MLHQDIREVLQEIAAARNDYLLFDNENMVCVSCGAEALGPSSAQHTDTCLITRAQRILEHEGR